jgi:hypothetical protein
MAKSHCNAALKEATTQKEMNAKWGSHVQSWQSRAQFACMVWAPNSFQRMAPIIIVRLML